MQSVAQAYTECYQENVAQWLPNAISTTSMHAGYQLSSVSSARSKLLAALCYQVLKDLISIPVSNIRFVISRVVLPTIVIPYKRNL